MAGGPTVRIALPSQTELRKLLRYEPDTGRFFWLPRHNARFDNQHAGKEAFTSKDEGYFGGGLLGVSRVQAHRVAFKYVHGFAPPEVDHINGDRADNRIENLRGVTTAENRKNCATPRSNTSGAVGVGYRRERGKWRAHIGWEGRTQHLGYFDTRDEAVAARSAAEARLGYHANHGRPQCSLSR